MNRLPPYSPSTGGKGGKGGKEVGPSMGRARLNLYGQEPDVRQAPSTFPTVPFHKGTGRFGAIS